MEKRENSAIKTILIIIGAVAAVAGIAYAVYRFFICDDYDEFDEDFYFDDDDIADLLEEDGVEEAETEE